MITNDEALKTEGLSRSYRFIFPERSLRGKHGELLGKNVGGAVEFHDHRPYFLGDDIRHIDWLVYGRSGSFVLKSYREEVTPTTEIISDFSRSMGMDDAKERLSRMLTLFLVNVFRANSVTPVLWKCGTSPEKILFGHRETAAIEPYDGRASLMGLVEGHYIKSKPNSMRVIISDFLFPHKADVLLRRLSSRAAGLLVIQIVSREDTDPDAVGGFLLEDCETREEFSLRITQDIIDSYRQRINNISAALEKTSRQLGGGFIRVHASDGLEGTIRKLIREGYLAPV